MIEKTKLSEVILLVKSYNLQDFIDWMHWHLDIIGFDCAHIFDNESLVDIKSVCDTYGDRVTYEKVIGWPNQYALYNRYINNESPAWWILPIDDDEFLWMKSFSNVNDMIIHYQEKWPKMNKLSIRWKNMFPQHPLELRGSKSLMEFNTNDNERWANLFEGGNKPVKTIVRVTSPIIYDIKTNQTHNPIANGMASYMCNGERVINNWYLGPNTDNDVKLLHYQFKSNDEWKWKCLHRTRVSIKNDIKYNLSRVNIVEKMR